MTKKRVLIIVATLLIVAGCSTTYYNMGGDPDGIRLQRIQSSPQYSVDQKRFENGIDMDNMYRRSRWEILWDFLFLDNHQRPDSELPTAQPDYAKLGDADQIQFIWYGHSTVLLQIDGVRILFDPIFSMYASPIKGFVKRFQDPVSKLEEIKDIDAILISHDHYDHLDRDTIDHLIERGVNFIVPLGVGAHLEAWGTAPENITELDWWETTQIGPVTFTCTPSQHFSGRGFLNRNSTLWSSWSVKGRKNNVFFSGDSGYGPHYKMIGERLGPFDLTFIENGAYNEDWRAVHHMPEEAVKAHLDLDGRTMVTIHWGMFDLSLHPWFEPIVRASEEASRLDVDLITPLMGELISLERRPENSAWWEPLIPTAFRTPE